jgi:prophage regulatory protein
MTEKILRRHAVEEMVGIGRSTLYAWVANGTFPKPVRLGVRAVGWRESEIVKWLAACKTTDQVD